MNDGDLVKTLKFKPDKYLGDPLNTIKIFNEKEVDELVLLDINATRKGREPDYELIKSVARECTMPFGYGGGIKNSKQATEIIAAGAEKIVLGDGVFFNKNLISETAEILGSQSVSVIINYKKNLFGNHHIYIKNGEKKMKEDVLEFLQDSQNKGAGELVLYNIDRDGTRIGYDFSLVDKAYSLISIPIAIIGGVGSHNHFEEAVEKYPVIGLGAGSFFTLVGRYKAVLISY
jgi:cyclase